MFRLSINDIWLYVYVSALLIRYSFICGGVAKWSSMVLVKKLKVKLMELHLGTTEYLHTVTCQPTQKLADRWFLLSFFAA